MQEMIHSVGADEFVGMGRKDEEQNVDKEKYDSTLNKNKQKKKGEQQQKVAEKKRQGWVWVMMVDGSEKEDSEIGRKGVCLDSILDCLLYTPMGLVALWNNNISNNIQVSF